MDDGKRTDIGELASSYLREIASLATALPKEQVVRLVDVLDKLRERGGKLLLCGNGGSSASAAHLAHELSKPAGGFDVPLLRAMDLTSNTQLLTAIANDLSYEQVFAEQVAQWIDPGDVLIAFSSRGNSPNVLRAIECANRRTATTIGMTGFDGGVLRDMVDLALVVDANSIEQVEDIHMIIGHIVVRALRQVACSKSITASAP